MTTEIMAAKQAQEMTEAFRTNTNVIRVIREIEREIKFAAIKGYSSMTTKVINDMKRDSEIEMVLSTFKSSGYTVEKKIAIDESDVQCPNGVVLAISWSEL